MTRIRLGSWIVLTVLLGASPAFAQTEEQKKAEAFFRSLSFQAGPCVAPIGTMAEIEIGEQYQALGPTDTRRLLKELGNIGESELALVAPKDTLSWFVVFEFENCGYVKDEDRGDLDADEILATIRKNETEHNKERQKRGLAAQKTLRWAVPPHYDDKTNNLEWAFVFESEGQETVNLNTRRLGRKGMMHVTLVCDPGDLTATLVPFRALMQGFRYKSEEAYASYRKGDKVADYTLAALVGGGALAVAAKMGILQKFWKFIVIGVVAVLGAVKKLFKRRPKTVQDDGVVRHEQ